ncbi:MAG: MoaD/ThiS family protein, partial [Candidatus Bathyarchaeia archaeon]
FIETRRNEKLSDIIHKLTESSPEFERMLIDPELKDPRPNAIILINGKELSVLKKGLETLVKNNDEIVFIPVIHGGKTFSFRY